MDIYDYVHKWVDIYDSVHKWVWIYMILYINKYNIIQQNTILPVLTKYNNNSELGVLKIWNKKLINVCLSLNTLVIS